MISAIPNETWFCNAEDVPNLPTHGGVKNGQTVIADDGKVYIFSKSKQEWKEM